MSSFTRVTAHDLRFRTSETLAGSDAMHPDGDYSAAYVVLETDAGDGLAGHGMTFTIGRGNELCVAAINALAPLVVGRDVEEVFGHPGRFWRSLASDSQLRWVGPEKGVIHLATAALVNAVWDLRAKRESKPLWMLLARSPTAELVDAIDFRYIEDALSPDEAAEILDAGLLGLADRELHLRGQGFPAYTTSVGWLGYPDEQIIELAGAAMTDGWSSFKLKVGADLQDDLRRVALLRTVIGDSNHLMVDANQKWGVSEAIDWIRELAPWNPLWVEEPTSPDDILGFQSISAAVAPVRLAGGEHVPNRVMFKQLLQAGAIGFCQLDMCRLGGVNEALAVMLMAAKFGIPCCPHSGGVGLSEYGQHLSMFDYLRVSRDMQGRMLEYVDHLHEHFIDPVVMRRGRYLVPDAPGSSIEMRPESIAEHRFLTPSAA